VFSHRLHHARHLLSRTRPLPGCMGMRGAGDRMGQCPAADATRDSACNGDRSGDNPGRSTRQHRHGLQRPAAEGAATRGSVAARRQQAGHTGSTHHGQRRQAHQEPVVKALERFAACQLAEEMEERLKEVASQRASDGVDVPGRRVYRQVGKGILKRLDAFEAYAPYVAQPECVKELHAMRIAAKRLRYLMQALAPLYPDKLAEPIQAARLCQAGWGDIQDCEVWIDPLPRFLDEEQACTLAYCGNTTPFEPLRLGILALHDNRQHQRAQDYQEFVTFWEQLQARGVWERLRQTLAAPCAVAAAARDKETTARAGDDGSAPTPQAVDRPVHDVKAERLTPGTVLNGSIGLSPSP